MNHIFSTVMNTAYNVGSGMKNNATYVKGVENYLKRATNESTKKPFFSGTPNGTCDTATINAILHAIKKESLNLENI